MRECYSRKKKTSRILRFLILLIMIAGVLFGVYASFAPVYTYAATYSIDLKQAGSVNPIMSESKEEFVVELVFEESPHPNEDKTRFDITPTSVQIKIPAGSKSGSTETKGAIRDFYVAQDGYAVYGLDTVGYSGKTRTVSMQFPSNLLGTTGLFEIGFTKYEETTENNVTTEHDEEIYVRTFIVDSSVPVLANLPEYTNSSFTVKATVSDGITGIYVFGPDGTMLSGTGSTSYTVSANAGDGVYECYAINDVGAQSEIVYVTLDTVAPTIKVDSLTYTDYVEVTASDDNEGAYIMGGIVGKTDKTYSNPYKISRDDAYGSYCFRAVDLAGNESAPIYFTVSSASVPGGLIFSEDGDGFKYEWGDETWTGTLEVAETDENGDFVLDKDGEVVYAEEEYISGTWITEEGKYKLILKGKSSSGTGESDENSQVVLEWEIQHYYVEVERVEHTRTEDGYIRYECPNCGDYYFKPLSHVFRLVSSKVANCTEAGEYCYECECGETYKETVEALGHLWVDSFTYTTAEVCGVPTYLRQSCSRCYATQDIPVTDENGEQVLNEHTGLIWILDGTYTTTEATSDFAAGTTLTSYASTCDSEGVVIKQCGSCGAIWAVKAAKREHWWISVESHYYGKGECYYNKGDNGVMAELTDVWVTVWECGYNDCDATMVEIKEGYYDGVFGELLDWFDRYQAWLWIIAGGFAIVWGIYGGIKYATAANEQGKEKAKKQLWTLIVGILLIFVIICGVPYLVRGIAYWII